MSISPIVSTRSNVSGAIGADKKPENTRFATLLRALTAGAPPQEAEAILAGSPPSQAKPLTDIQLAELRRQVENSLSALERNLKQLMLESGVDTTQQLRLVSDGQGGVVLANFHSDQDKIEQIFKDNPDLADAFQELASNASRLERIEHGPAAGEPIFAPVFGLNLHEDEVQISFE